VYTGVEYIAHPQLSYTVTAENSFSSTVGVSITATEGSSAGVEGVASASFSLSLEANFSFTVGKSVSYSHQIQQTLDVTVKDKSKVAILSLKEGKIVLPFTSTAYYKNGSTYKSSGTYEGVAFGEIRSTVEDTP